ncbi:hypothetical protein D3C72_1201100 [compost metagenome]
MGQERKRLDGVEAIVPQGGRVRLPDQLGHAEVVEHADQVGPYEPAAQFHAPFVLALDAPPGRMREQQFLRDRRGEPHVGVARRGAHQHQARTGVPMLERHVSHGVRPVLIHHHGFVRNGSRAATPDARAILFDVVRQDVPAPMLPCCLLPCLVLASC